MIKKEITKSVKTYVDAQNNLLAALKKLENWGKKCNCNGSRKFIVMDSGTPFAPGDQDYEIVRYCLTCGGDVETQ